MLRAALCCCSKRAFRQPTTARRPTVWRPQRPGCAGGHRMRAPRHLTRACLRRSRCTGLSWCIMHGNGRAWPRLVAAQAELPARSRRCFGAFLHCYTVRCAPADNRTSLLSGAGPQAASRPRLKTEVIRTARHPSRRHVGACLIGGGHANPILSTHVSDAGRVIRTS